MNEFDGDAATHDLAVVICENVYLHKVLAYTQSKSTRLQEQLHVAHIALQTLHSMSLKPAQQTKYINQLSQQMERLSALEETLDGEIQAYKEKEDDSIWLQTHVNYLKEENRLAKLFIQEHKSILVKERY